MFSYFYNNTLMHRQPQYHSYGKVIWLNMHHERLYLGHAKVQTNKTKEIIFNHL